MFEVGDKIQGRATLTSYRVLDIDKRGWLLVKSSLSIGGVYWCPPQAFTLIKKGTKTMTTTRKTATVATPGPELGFFPAPDRIVDHPTLDSFVEGDFVVIGDHDGVFLLGAQDAVQFFKCGKKPVIWDMDDLSHDLTAEQVVNTVISFKTS